MSKQKIKPNERYISVQVIEHSSAGEQKHYFAFTVKKLRNGQQKIQAIYTPPDADAN